MIFNNIEFHNVEELRHVEGREGLLLLRIPEDIRNLVNAHAQLQYTKPAGVEIRFVCETFPVTVKLVNYGKTEKAAIYFGDYQHKEIIIAEGHNELVINIPDRFVRAKSLIKDYLYSPGVIRIIFLGLAGQIHFIEASAADGFLRPPFLYELPSLRYLAYGTSITHGSVSTSPVLTFASQTAWRLGADLVNLGTGGSALCEAVLGNYIAQRSDWDIMTLCISVNMLNQGVGVDEFYDKAKYFITRIAEKNPGKPIFCISILPFFMDIGIVNNPQSILSTPGEYRTILKRIIDELKKNNVFYIDGRDILDRFSGLSADLIHPGNLGMIIMGENLAKIISGLIKKK